MPRPFYYTVVAIGTAIFWQSSRPIILHRDRIPRTGPFILAANHIAPFDPAILMRHTPRILRFVTMKELLSSKMGWFFRGMDTIPLARTAADPAAVRAAVDHLATGGAVGIFPEGRIRTAADSVALGHPCGPGAVKLALLASAPILPAIVWNTQPYRKWHKWLPRKSVRYGVAYGSPFTATTEEEATKHLAAQWQSLYQELAPRLPH